MGKERGGMEDWRGLMIYRYVDAIAIGPKAAVGLVIQKRSTLWKADSVLIRRGEYS